MKEEKLSKKMIGIIIAIIIIAGIIVFAVKGLNFELDYSDRQEFTISTSTQMDKSKVEEIAKSVLTDRKVEVNAVETFGNAMRITSNYITDEEKENIVNKINEEYSSDIKNEDIVVASISKSGIKNMAKHYVLPIVITFVIILAYFMIMYHKIGVKEVALKSVLIPLICELIYYSIIAIARIPFGNTVIAITLGIYVVCMLIASTLFEKKKKSIINLDKKENEE